MQDNKFNSYKDGLNLQFLLQYCKEHGTVKTLERGEALETIGLPARWVAYVEQGYLKYVAYDEQMTKDFCVGFAFEGEFVADYPNCLCGERSEVTIEAGLPSKVLVIEGAELLRMYHEDFGKMNVGMQIIQNLFNMLYTRYLDLYRSTARDRYRDLLCRCPQVVRHLPLKDIASFLNITPQTLSKIRKEITFKD